MMDANMFTQGPAARTTQTYLEIVSITYKIPFNECMTPWNGMLTQEK